MASATESGQWPGAVRSFRPNHQTEPEMPNYSRQTDAKRYTIEALHCKRTPQIKIAKILDVHPSTISRELLRLSPGRPYSYRQAHQELKKCDQTSDPQLLSLAVNCRAKAVRFSGRSKSGTHSKKGVCIWI